MAVRVITDSTSYLPSRERERFGISVASLGVSFADGSAQREVDVEDREFYARLESTGEIPTSSQPSVHELSEAFGSCVAAGDDVVGVFISSAMSGTFETAQLARSMVIDEHPGANIELVDSRSNCMQLGMCALQAARAARDGADAERAAEVARETVARTRFVFTPHDLEYLKRGGRIGGASALLGSLLQVRPILTVENGETAVYGKVRTKRRAMDELVNAMMLDASNSELEEVIVHHIDDEPEGAQLAALVEQACGVEAPVLPIGPVIGLHVGPGSVGIVYRTREPVARLDERKNR